MRQPVCLPVQYLVDTILRLLSTLCQSKIHVSDGGVILHALLKLFTSILIEDRIDDKMDNDGLMIDWWQNDNMIGDWIDELSNDMVGFI